MRFINIRGLKADLERGPLPSGEVAKYLALQSALGAIVFVPGAARADFTWEYLTLPCVALAGVVFCHRSNGGAAGIRLAERYLAIGWVVGWRVGLVTGTAVGIFLVASGLTGRDAWLDSPFMSTAWRAFTHAMIAFLYWRIGVQLRAVHQRSALQQTPQTVTGMPPGT